MFLSPQVLRADFLSDDCKRYCQSHSYLFAVGGEGNVFPESIGQPCAQIDQPVMACFDVSKRDKPRNTSGRRQKAKKGEIQVIESHFSASDTVRNWNALGFHIKHPSGPLVSRTLHRRWGEGMQKLLGKATSFLLSVVIGPCVGFFVRVDGCPLN